MKPVFALLPVVTPIVVRVVALIMIGCGVPHVYAHSYGARIDKASWDLAPAPLSCRLTQDVPAYGTAVFERLAGEDSAFYLESLRPQPKSGRVQIWVEGPTWRPDIQRRDLGEANSEGGHRPVQVGPTVADAMLAELAVGLSPTMRHESPVTRDPLVVKLSSVRFQAAYDDFISCVSGLYPVGFRQVRESLLNFETDKHELTEVLRKRLDLIAGYVQLDPEIKKIYIGGHTDSDGRRYYNQELSKRRAEAVRAYLETQGVFPEMLQVEFFGETRPLKRNTTNQNKAANRRVLVRLDRQ